mmetsp:Transcript_25317/g.52677  ORF Transcript_25317/g.52677 Transcript_25317/m.52677 type:complete len:109 (-) Transcript_25317:76-402(-)
MERQTTKALFKSFLNPRFHSSCLVSNSRVYNTHVHTSLEQLCSVTLYHMNEVKQSIDEQMRSESARDENAATTLASNNSKPSINPRCNDQHFLGTLFSCLVFHCFASS